MIHAFDGLVEKLVGEDGIAVIDNGAATFVPLMSYMAENEVPSFLVENGIRMIIHVPLVGGQALDDCITGLVQTLNALQAEVVIWLNDFQGAVAKEKPFEEFGVYQEYKNRIIGVVPVSHRNPDTFGADIKEMTTKNLTLTEAQNSGGFGLMPRQRLRFWCNVIYTNNRTKSRSWRLKRTRQRHDMSQADVEAIIAEVFRVSGIKLTADDPVIAIPVGSGGAAESPV